MPDTPGTSQLTLSLFDTTALSGGLTLDAPMGGLRFREPEGDDPDDTPPAPAAAARVPPRNWRLVGDRALAHGWKARAADNVEAIRLAHAIAAEDRHATAEEQEVLSRFTGFGASELANSLFRRPNEAFRPGWENLGRELEQLVTPEQMAGLARATQYAHYTPEFIVRAIWGAVTRMGFAGGTVLEPGCGTGLFLALMPETLVGKTVFTAVEMDPCTAGIATLLHPDAWVRCEDFTKARIAETFEVAIGNPPFSDRTVRAGDPAGKLGLSLHDYFIARSIERLKPGGLGAFVTSRFTMDKSDPTARAHIAAMADLLAGVRLPAGSMQAASGTEVVVDVLLFQKRAPGAPTSAIEWDGLMEVVPEEDGEPALYVNRYFAEHPDMVLGRHGRTSGPFGPTYTCRGDTGPALAEALGRALACCPESIHMPPDAPVARRPEASRIVVGTAAEGATVKEGSYLVLDGHLVQAVDGVPVPVAVRSGTGGEGIPAKHARILRALIPVRDWTRAVLRAQEANEPWTGAQVRLRVAYNTFKRNFGPINLTSVSTSTDPKTGEERETVRRPNLQPFLDDPDCWLVSSIEHYDEDSGTAKPGPIFSERVIHPPAAPLLQTAARAMLRFSLSCRDNWSQSGPVAHIAGDAVGADNHLPNMATADFLACLSKAAVEGVALDLNVPVQPTGKATRGAVVARVGEGRWIYPPALFAAAEAATGPVGAGKKNDVLDHDGTDNVLSEDGAGKDHTDEDAGITTDDTDAETAPPDEHDEEPKADEPPAVPVRRRRSRRNSDEARAAA